MTDYYIIPGPLQLGKNGTVLTFALGSDDAPNDMYYRNDDGNVTRLPIVNPTQVLQVGFDNKPTWVYGSGGGSIGQGANGCSMIGSNLSIPHNTETTLVNFISPSTLPFYNNNNILNVTTGMATIPVSARYIISVHVLWDNSTSRGGTRTINLYRNGTVFESKVCPANPSSDIPVDETLEITVFLIANDVIHCTVQQTSGVTIPVLNYRFGITD
jgi:hypothetical protein